jgi:hypothetical protein
MMRLLRVLVVLSVPFLILWACAALWVDGPASRFVAAALVAGFAISTLVLLGWVRPFRRGLAGFGLLFLGVLFWWLLIEPSNDRDWEPSVARPAVAAIEGDRVTISNVRNFDYRTEQDYTERWEERTYDLSKLRGVDLFLSYWGSPWIAHTIVSWAFDDGRHLAVSIETRKEAHESYSALLGFFRQFELYYVVADERDLIRVRTNYRGEQVYLYHLDLPLEMARAVLLDYSLSGPAGTTRPPSTARPPSDIMPSRWPRGTPGTGESSSTAESTSSATCVEPSPTACPLPS